MKKMFFPKKVLIILMIYLFGACSNSDTDNTYLLIGTYTSGESEGIYIYDFNENTGKYKYISKSTVENPSFLSISPDNSYVYAVSENDSSTALINAFAFDKANGTLKFINSQSTLGGAPCYVSVDPQQKYALTANYSGGSISVFALKSNGELSACEEKIVFEGTGEDSVRQSQSHLHTVRFTPDGKYLFATDLGMDKIYQYPLNYSDTGNFLVNKGNNYTLKAGSGPRHLDFSPNGQQIYLLTELSGEVLTYNYNSGELEQIQVLTADTLKVKGSADIKISPNGKYVYASNRLQGDGIAIFKTDERGYLTKIGYQLTGKHPRNFGITPNGKYLLCANRDSNNIQIFEIKEDGLLEDTNSSIQISMPVCIQFLNKN